jgi:hypothetical protein
MTKVTTLDRVGMVPELIKAKQMLMLHIGTFGTPWCVVYGVCLHVLINITPTTFTRSSLWILSSSGDMTKSTMLNRLDTVPELIKAAQMLTLHIGTFWERA